MPILVLAAALLADTERTGATALPRAINPETWFRYTDYPSGALGGERVGTTWFEITVDQSGKPIGCRTILSSGSPDLDRQSCVSPMVRGRLEPARDQHGKPAYGSVRRRTTWSMPPRQPTPAEMPPDANLQVNALPSKAKAFTTVRLVEASDGSVEHCEVHETSSNAQLDKLACDTASKAMFPDRPVDASGAFVRAVRLRKIAFSVAAGR